MHIQYNDFYGNTLSIRTLAQRGQEIYNLVRPFLGHHSYIHVFYLSDALVVATKRRRNIAFSIYDHAPAQEPLLLGS